jgi:hypothetical protein
MRFAAAPIRPRRLVWLAAALIAGLATLALLVGLGSQPAHANPGAVENLTGCTTASNTRTDDGSSDLTPLGFTINYFGTTYSSIFVNNNGNVTFDAPLDTYTPESIVSAGKVIIAPFWADVDFGESSGSVTYGQTTFQGHPAFCADWPNVGYFSSHDDKLNTFQLLIVDRSETGAGDFDMIMNYDKVQWESGDVSGGNQGLGGFSARLGYSNGSDVSFEYPGSGVNGAFLDSSATGLSHNSRDSLINGRYVFEVRSGAPPAGGSVSGHIYRADTSATLPGALVALCTNKCNTTNADSNGFYSMTGLSAGNYVLFVYPPNADAPIRPYDSDPFQVAATDVIQHKDAALEAALLPAAGTTFSPQLNPNQAVPWMNWSSAMNMTEPGPPGLGTIFADVKQNGVVIASFTLTETPPGSGSYSGTIPDLQPHHGWVQVVKHLPSGDEIFDVWVDPSGAVKTVSGDPIQGATVTLYRSDSASGPFEVVPDGSVVMSVANRVNPGSTDVNGHFGWDVIAGFYKVRAEKSGCHEPDNSSQAFVETDVLTIPPPVTDLDLRLDCGGASATPTPTPTTDVWGDPDCNGSVAPRDGQAILNHFLGKTELSQTPPCPAIGAPVTIDGMSYVWGDPDCNGSVAPRDGQAILNHFLGKTELSQTLPCPAIGSTVTLQ